MILGAVLAGGQSSRMGTDKCEVIVGGEALWRRQARVLREGGADSVVLIRRPGQTAPAEIPCWRDLIANAGPIAGLQAALARQAAPWVAVLAVDMPGIDAGWFRWLRGFCQPGRGAMARHPQALEPLAAIYPAEALVEINHRVEQGDFSLQRLGRALAEAGLLTLLPLSAAEGAKTASVNTPRERKNWE